MTPKVKYLLVFLILGFLITANILQAQEEVWFAKGEKAFKNKEYFEAINAFSQVIEIMPEDKDSYYYRGLAYLYTEDAESAEKDFTKLIKLDSTYPDAYNNRGLCRGYLGDVDGAIDDFKKAIALDSKFDKAYLNLGSAYLAKNDYKNAMKNLNKVIELDKKNPENYFLRGTVYYLEKEYQLAAYDFTKSIELGLKISKTYYNRANANYKLEKYSEVIDDFTKVLEINPDDTEALNNRAMAYTKVGLDELAEQDRLKIAAIMTGVDEMPDIEKLNFKRFSFLNNKISIELPDSWYSVKDTTGFGEIMIVTMDSVGAISDKYLAGVRMAFDSNMSGQFKVRTTGEILGFWEYNSELNKKSYKDYHEFFKKSFEKSGYEGNFKEVRIVVDDKSFPVRLYEIVLAKDDKLFYFFMQSPDPQFEYYKKIYDRVIESLKIDI